MAFSENLTGANCHLSGQTILSLQVTEDAGTDFASASVTTLAPGGPHALRSVVETVEGGVSTGSWVVVKRTVLNSGEKTWRRRDGDAAYRHLSYVTYTLRRAGYLEARATISKGNVGADNWPPKFWSAEWWRLHSRDLTHRWLWGELTWWEYDQALRGALIVSSGNDLISRLAGWFGLSVSFWVSCPVLPEEYVPVGQTLLSAIREVASWSAADVYLGRSGLVVYSFEDVFSRGRSVPRPTAVLEREVVDEVPDTSLITVVGEEYGYQQVIAEEAHREKIEDENGDEQWVWVPPKRELERQAHAVERSTHITGAEPDVEERHEIKEYSLTEAIAQKICRQKIARLVLENELTVWRGPGEGSQSIEPLFSQVLGINRSLQWDGTKYRYEIDIRGPKGRLSWNRPKVEGWW